MTSETDATGTPVSTQDTSSGTGESTTETEVAQPGPAVADPEDDHTQDDHTEGGDTDGVDTEADDTGSDDTGSDDAPDDTADNTAPDNTAPDNTGAAPKSTRRAALEAEGDVAADFLEALLDICDIDGDIDVDIDGDRAAVSIVDSDEGRVPRRMVGPDGKVLEALQELTRLAVQSETGDRSRLMLDVAGHRAARKAEIVEIARGVIEDVRNSGDQVEMQPMTAFERKIVHDEVLAAGLRSESDGVEPRRFVVVLPAG